MDQTINDGKPKWNPRVPRHKIWQLYHNDAMGLQDEDLVNDVGLSLLLRVESCLIISEAQQGRVKCPVCGTIIERDLRPHRPFESEMMVCSNCNWQLPWMEYWQTFHNKHLGCAGMLVPCQEFAREYPKAKTYQEKMVLIDTLIHRFHWQMEGHAAQPGAATIIGGSMAEIADFLDELAYSQESTPGLRERRDEWREIAKDKYYGPTHS
jgi:predicted RNA-binding Zn-ribbon protein involved in translation (DUF1610 family)